MSSALDDPRAAELTGLQVPELHSLATHFTTVSTQAGDAITALHGAHGDATWTGNAADKFRTGLGKLPGDLQTVHESYSDTASALGTYADQVEPIRSRWITLAGQLQSAQQQVSTAQTNLSTAKSGLTTAKSAPGAKPSSTAVTQASGDVTKASGALTSLTGDLDGLNTQGLRILDEFDGVRGTAISALKTAGHKAPQHHSSFWGSVGHVFSNVVKGVGDTFVNLAKDTWKAARSLPNDVVTVAEHPGNLKDWTKLGEDLGTVAGAVAMVAAVVVCPADALGFEAAADAIEVVGDGAETVMTYQTGEKTLDDTCNAATGQGSWKTVGEDEIANIGGKVMGKISGDDGAKELTEGLENKSKGIAAYKEATANGKTAKEAMAGLKPEQREMLKGSARQLRSPTRINRLTSVTESKLKTVKTSYRQIHAVKTVVGDPVTDKVTEKVGKSLGLDTDDGGDGDKGGKQ